MSQASRVCLAGQSSTVQAGWAVLAMQGTHFQREVGWAKGCSPVGQSQRTGSCHTERQNAEREGERGKMEGERGQGSGGRYGEERVWTEWRTPTCSCKHGHLT